MFEICAICPKILLKGRGHYFFSVNFALLRLLDVAYQFNMGQVLFLTYYKKISFSLLTLSSKYGISKKNNMHMVLGAVNKFVDEKNL